MTAVEQTNDVIYKRVYVGGLHSSITEAQVIDRFKKYGDIDQVTIAKDQEGQCRGFGHMTIKTTSQQWKNCLSVYNGSKWKGCQLRLEDAHMDYKERKQKEDEALALLEKQRERKLRRAFLSKDAPGRLRKDMSLVTDNNMDSRKGWKRGRYGRAIALMRLRRPDGTKIVFDPSHYKNNLTKLYNIGVRMRPVSQLRMTYEEYEQEDKEREMGHESSHSLNVDDVDDADDAGDGASDHNPGDEDDLENYFQNFQQNDGDDDGLFDQSTMRYIKQEPEKGTEKEDTHHELANDTGNTETTNVTSEPHFEVNVNLKPLFGEQTNEPFKLFGGDHRDSGDDSEIDTENELVVTQKSKEANKELSAGQNTLFFFHFEDPVLSQRSCFDYNPNGIFQPTLEDKETYEARWRERRPEIGDLLRRKHKHAVKRQKTMQTRGIHKSK